MLVSSCTLGNLYLQPSAGLEVQRHLDVVAGVSEVVWDEGVLLLLLL